MPFPFLPIAMVAGNAINALSTGIQNRRQREYNIEMYERQRSDALADWSMQNVYNSPAEQMKRLKAAGLNPNLVYGNGATALSGSGVRSAQVESYRPTPVQVDTGGIVASLLSQYNLEKIQAQTDNVAAATKLSQEQALTESLKRQGILAGIDRTKVSTAQGKFNLGLAEKLESMNLEQAAANLAKTKADIYVSLSRNEREILANANTLRLGLEQVLNYRIARAKTSQEISNLRQAKVNLQKDASIKQFEIDLNKRGFTRSDEWYYRVGGKILDNLISNPGTKKYFGHGNKGMDLDYPQEMWRTLDSLKSGE